MSGLTATARIPCRPLSYEYKDLAEDKELLVDYTNGNVFIKMSDGTFTDIGNSVKEIVIKNIKEDTEIANSITIEIEGAKYELNTIIAQEAEKIDDIQNALGYYIDDQGNPQFDILNKVVTVDSSGKLNVTINTGDIKETNDKYFVSNAEKQKIAASTHSEFLTVTIPTSWSGSEAPYSQQINVSGILSTDYPVIDVILSDNYATAQNQLDNYAYIYRVVTYNGYIIVYANQPTTIAIQVRLKVDR